jgi:hypothetical protein
MPVVAAAVRAGEPAACDLVRKRITWLEREVAKVPMAFSWEQRGVPSLLEYPEVGGAGRGLDAAGMVSASVCCVVCVVWCSVCSVVCVVWCGVVCVV